MDITKKISAERFLFLTLMISVLAAAVIIGLNMYIDLYGLFLPVKGRTIDVKNNERTSKYLLSYRYIPQNFNTILAGTSLSDNLDVTPFTGKGDFTIYNASIMGANISEIKPVVINAVEGGVKNVILCITPYLVKTSGGKEVEFGPKVYRGALGSVDLYQTYAVGLIRYYNLMPHKFPRNQINSNGVNDYADFFRLDDVKGKIHQEVVAHGGKNLRLDTTAVSQLKEMIQFLKDRKINLICYFHPVPLEIYDSNQVSLDHFQKMVRDIVADDTKVIDFNAPSNHSFTSDYSNYIDHGHLSKKGQATIMQQVYAKLDSLY